MTITEDQPKRARNARGEGTKLRQEILEATESLLETLPVEKVTLRGIAREAGVAAPSIYRHFSDLDAILRALVVVAFDDLTAELSRAQSGTRPSSRLRQSCAAYLAFAESQPQRYRLLFGGVWNAAEAAPASPEEYAARREIGMNALGVIATTLAECVEAGESTSPDPSADATALWVAMHGLAELRRTTPMFPWPEALDDRLIDTVARLR
ncbi:TetR/AcrR family transcriptional regulator [Arenivirga flava]|uniref:Transcriptional regulator, TetR family protein n=1 Tax=Arenivirga flava TaxID=1930060 RepID=A0AA37XBW8_9MICO|nr:TetR/AcrR family transcriptional regulator [Arenivirga flava]GMA28860.1 putative transcriptional regulator, TetR family protein [Arenivirga flava]